MGKSLIIQGGNFYANAIERGYEPVPYTLYQGYAAYATGTSGVEIDSELQTRVRTSELSGSYIVKTKSGFVIRAILKYKPFLNESGAGTYPTTTRENVGDVQGSTEYTLENPGGYSIITFCKADASANISPNEDIVDSIMRP